MLSYKKIEVSLKKKEKNSISVNPYQIYHTYSHMLITPVSTLKFSHENFNMQIRLKLCHIWRVEKFHT